MRYLTYHTCLSVLSIKSYKDVCMKKLAILLFILMVLTGCGNTENGDSNMSTLSQQITTRSSAIKASTAVPNTLQQINVLQLLQVMFNAAPGSDFLNQFAGLIAGGISINQLADMLAGTDLFKSSSLYPDTLTNQQFAERLINNLLDTTVSEVNRTWAKEWITGQLNNGTTRGSAIWAAITALMAVPSSDRNWGTAVMQLNNKVTIGYYYSVTKRLSSSNLSVLQKVTSSVTSDPATVIVAKTNIDNLSVVSVEPVQMNTIFISNASVTLSPSLFLNDNENYTITSISSSMAIYGGPGINKVYINAGTSNLKIDQNVEQIVFPYASNAYTFKQTGNVLNVYDSSGVVLIAAITIQKAGTTLYFKEGGAQFILVTSGVMIVGEKAVSTNVPSSIDIFNSVVNPSTGGSTQTPTLTVTSKPNSAGHAGVYYATKVTVKIVNQSNVAMVGVKPTLTFNDEGWVRLANVVTDSQGNISYDWAPGQSSTPSITISYGGVSTTVTGTTATWSSNISQISISLQDNISHLNAKGIQRQVTPLTDPDKTYYAVHQWDGGYTGLQKGGSRYDRQLQFSVWNGTDANGNVIKTSVVSPGTSTCVPFDNEGTGIKCENTYPWVVGRTYQFTVTSVNGVGYRDITSIFTDVSNGATVNLGTLRYYTVSSTVFSSGISFVEDFGSEPNCFTVSDRSAIFSTLKYYNGSTWVTWTGQTGVSGGLTTETCAMRSSSHTTTGTQLNVGKSFKTTTVQDYVIYD